MRIVYYLPDIDAGVSRIVINLLRFRPRNHAIKYAVVLINRKGTSYKRISEDMHADEVIRFNYQSEENAFAVFKRLSKTLKSENDIIVGNDGLEIKMVVTQKLKNPVVYILHGDFPSYYSLVKSYYPVIDSLITYSTKIENTIKEIPGVNCNAVHKIYYPSAIKQRENHLRKRSIFKILFAGLLIQRKGADLLPKIYTALKENGVDEFELEIIGEGELLPELTIFFKDCSNVFLPGWQNQQYVRQAMEEADVFLFPSRLEGLPNVLVEALSAVAVPVVSDLESGVADIIQNGVNGLLIEKDNVNMFAKAIANLYQNKVFFEQLKKNNWMTLQMFEPYQQAAAYETAIANSGNYVTRKKRSFPKYKKGRVLDISWVPDWLVFSFRRIIKYPKL